MFWKRKNDSGTKNPNPLGSDEYERLLKRFLETDSGLKSLKVDVEIIRTDVANLRGKFNLAIRGVKDKQELEEPTKDLNLSDNLPFG